ncbi:MAG: hypothetical protein ACK5WX_01955 [bacterium]
MHSLHTAVTVASLAVATCATSAFAQSGAIAYTDSQGRQWRQVDSTTGHTWNAVAAVCPTDGVTPCAGTLGAVQVDGWVWATQQDVLELFAEFSPAVAKSGVVSGPQFFFAGFGFLTTFNPTFSVQTTFGSELGLWGWTSTTGAGGKAIAPGITAQTNPASGALNANLLSPRNEADADRGVWLYKPANGAGCAADLDQNGSVGASDLSLLLSSWGGGGAADLNGNGVVGAEDLSVMLAAWGAGNC